MITDLLNAVFWIVGTAAIWPSIQKIQKDKSTEGVHPWTVAFLSVWSFEATFVYALWAWCLSLLSALSMAIVEGYWLYLVLKYGEDNWIRRFLRNLSKNWTLH